MTRRNAEEGGTGQIVPSTVCVRPASGLPHRMHTRPCPINLPDEEHQRQRTSQSQSRTPQCCGRRPQTKPAHTASHARRLLRRFPRSYRHPRGTASTKSLRSKTVPRDCTSVAATALVEATCHVIGHGNLCHVIGCSTPKLSLVEFPWTLQVSSCSPQGHFL